MKVKINVDKYREMQDTIKNYLYMSKYFNKRISFWQKISKVVDLPTGIVQMHPLLWKICPKLIRKMYYRLQIRTARKIIFNCNAYNDTHNGLCDWLKAYEKNGDLKFYD